jgi:DHA1 family multidrug resistance protein-like MFS transporter
MTKPTASLKYPTRWRRTLVIIWFAELVAIVGFTVVVPLLPLYVAELGVRGEQGIRLWSGIIFSGHAVALGIFGPIWGALGDRRGRKLMLERAMFGGAAVVATMGLARTVQQLALLRVLQGALTGTVFAANALVATAVPRKHSGMAMGLLQVAIYLGASIGPMIGGLVAETLGFRVTFWVTGSLLFVAAVAVLLLVEEQFQPIAPPHDGRSEGGAIRPSVIGRVRGYLAPVVGSSALLGIFTVRLLMRSGARLTVPVLPLFVEALAPAGTRVAWTSGLIAGASAFAGAVGALGLGWLGDRSGYRPILIACAVVSVVCYVPQYFVEGLAELLLWQMGTGLAMGGVLAAVSASLARLAPDGQEGIVYGVDASVVAAANAVGPMLGSALAAWVGLRVPFLVAAGLFVLGGIAAAELVPRQSPSVRP